jgi:rSAM/selenodomain-associated transferase 1
MINLRRQRVENRASRHRAAPFRWRLVVMAKGPVAGQVKTRLAREIGVAVATRFARHSTEALLQRVGFDPRWQAVLAITPDHAVTARLWPLGIARMAQGTGDLGRRMQRIFQHMPPGPVVIIGTDIPGMQPACLAKAFRLLGRHDAVFGPAIDGGYWLVGMRRRPRLLRPFSGVRWSSAQALGDTLANLSERSVGFVATLSDVDDARDLARCGSHAGRRVWPVAF